MKRDLLDLENAHKPKAYVHSLDHLTYEVGVTNLR